jgi:hypothetical protein
MMWVWKYNEESRLQIEASLDCANICSRAPFHARQNSPFTRPWTSQSFSTAVRRGCWPKGRRTNCLYLRGRFSERYAAPKSKMVLQEKVQPRTRERVWHPKWPKCHEDKQIARRWSHDQKTRRPTTKSSIQSQTQRKEKSRKTEIQVGGWGEQR